MSPDVQDDRTLSDRIAEEIRVLLTRRRMSGRELARRLDVSPGWVSYRLSGEQEIGTNDLQRIAAVLGVSASDLLPPSTRASSPTLVDPLAQRVIATVGAPKRRRTQPHTPIRGNRPSPVRVRPLTPVSA
jgi:transcriptional regulator with XRE-family HTH domain